MISIIAVSHLRRNDHRLKTIATKERILPDIHQRGRQEQVDQSTHIWKATHAKETFQLERILPSLEVRLLTCKR